MGSLHTTERTSRDGYGELVLALRIVREWEYQAEGANRPELLPHDSKLILRSTLLADRGPNRLLRL